MQAVRSHHAHLTIGTLQLRPRVSGLELLTLPLHQLREAASHPLDQGVVADPHAGHEALAPPRRELRRAEELGRRHLGQVMLLEG